MAIDIVSLKKKEKKKKQRLSKNAKRRAREKARKAERRAHELAGKEKHSQNKENGDSGMSKAQKQGDTAASAFSSTALVRHNVEIEYVGADYSAELQKNEEFQVFEKIFEKFAKPEELIKQPGKNKKNEG